MLTGEIISFHLHVNSTGKAESMMGMYYVPDIKYLISMFALRPAVHSRSLNIVQCLLRGALRIPSLTSLCFNQWVNFTESL